MCVYGHADMILMNMCAEPRVLVVNPAVKGQPSGVKRQSDVTLI